MESVLDEIPVRRIIIVDAGSIDRTKEIALSFDKVEFYSKPEMNLGEATKFGFFKSQTEWVAVIDSDVILRQGWFDNMKKHMDGADAVEGCRVDHYVFTVRTDITKSTYGRFGQTLLKREPVLHMDMNLQYGEDTLTKFNFDKEGKRWKKVENFLADHYTSWKIQNITAPGLCSDQSPRSSVYKECANTARACKSEMRAL